MNTQGPGQVEIAFEYNRHVGPRYIHGAVTLQFDSLQPYRFVSEVAWPNHENYDVAIQEGIEMVLLELQGSLDKTLVVLKSISWNEISSCKAGFVKAAQAATRASFNV